MSNNSNIHIKATSFSCNEKQAFCVPSTGKHINNDVFSLKELHKSIKCQHRYMQHKILLKLQSHGHKR